MAFGPKKFSDPTGMGLSRILSCKDGVQCGRHCLVDIYFLCFYWDELKIL